MIFGFYCFPLFSLPLPRFLSFIFILFFLLQFEIIHYIQFVGGGGKPFQKLKNYKNGCDEKFQASFFGSTDTISWFRQTQSQRKSNFNKKK